jgi:hypothetical protein
MNKYPVNKHSVLDAELLRMINQVNKRGYTNAKMEVIYERANQQKLEGDVEYNRSPSMKTILRRVLRSEYDHLFN